MIHLLTWRHDGPEDCAKCCRCERYLAIEDLGIVPCIPWPTE